MTIIGRNVRLRALEIADSKHIHVWNNDAEFMRSYFYQPEHVISLEHLELELAPFVKNERPDHRIFVIEKLADNKPIGLVNFRSHHPKKLAVEVGVGIGEKAEQGNGYGTEAMRLLVEFLFGELNVHRIELTTLATNEAARKCFEKCGFIEEGRKRDAAFFDGRFHDLILMAQLKPDAEKKGDGR